VKPVHVRTAYAAAVISLTGMIGLSVAWELWLAPLRPGGSWMVLKVVPLMAPLFGILHGRVYTYRWASMLLIAYFVEGSFRAYAETGLSSALAMVEIVLSLVFIVAAGAYIRGQPSSSQARRPDADP